MSKIELPQDLVQASLKEAIRFGEGLGPLLVTSALAAKTDIQKIPTGGDRCPKAELQGMPTLFRVRVHQMIQGRNKIRLRKNEPETNAKHMRNVAVCLCELGRETRLYKANNLHLTRYTGAYQSKLIRQVRYQNWLKNPGMFPEMPPLLDSLLYYRLDGLDFVGLDAIIPNGFESGGTINCVARSPINLVGDLLDIEDQGVFAGGDVNVALIGEDGILLSTDDIDPEFFNDPFGGTQEIESEPVADNQEGSILAEEDSDKNS